jgi:hypothetical protein
METACFSPALTRLAPTRLHLDREKHISKLPKEPNHG